MKVHQCRISPKSKCGHIIFLCICVTLVFIISNNMSIHMSNKPDFKVRLGIDFLQKSKLDRMFANSDVVSESQYCTKPKMSLYHDTIKDVFHEMEPLSCTGKSLFYITSNTLYINNSVLNPELSTQYFNLKEFDKSTGAIKSIKPNKLKSCEYQGIERLTDSYFTYTESFTKTEAPFNLIIKHDFIRISCFLDDEDEHTDKEINNVSKVTDRQIQFNHQHEYVNEETGNTAENGQQGDHRDENYSEQDDEYPSEKMENTTPDFDQFLVQIYPKPEVFDRISRIKRTVNDMNVMIIGLDSLSHLSFQRKLPSTYRYLKNVLNSVVLNFYNIVGDGTTAALIPMFTGKTEMELPEVRINVPESKSVDVYPMIWNKFQTKGYVTLYAEDEPSINTFNLRLNGFNTQPTDHYMRPFWQAIWNSELRETSHKYCTGNVPHHMYMLNYLKDYYIKYQNVSKFSFTFLTEQTHWNNDPGQYVDRDLYELLQYFDQSGFLENTLLIMMADHGARYSKVRNTVQGKMEERLPMMSLRFPVWFQKRYPKLIKNLMSNSDRLSTPFDIHETLLDIVDFSRMKTKVHTPAHRGISLLQQLPSNRTCASAGIETHWCSCLTSEEQNITSKHVQKIAISVMQFINDMTEPLRQHCRKLQLKKIYAAYLLVPNKKVLKFLKMKDADQRIADFSEDIKIDAAHYQVTIETSPSNAVFEATVVKHIESGEIKVFPQISRLDHYGNQPACVQVRYPDLRRYCLCRDFPLPHAA